MADDVLDYSQPGPFTSLDATQFQLIGSLPDDPVGICAAAQGLAVQPAHATAAGTLLRHGSQRRTSDRSAS